jgi:ubiquinone/menaquinone biosynthesis C-methylase UbiE
MEHYAKEYKEYGQKTKRRWVPHLFQVACSLIRNVWIPKTYDIIAKYYDCFLKWFFPVAEKAQRKVVEELNSGSILDVACGTGSVLAMAYKKGLKCYGIDVSEGMLRQAKLKVPHAELQIADFQSIPYPHNRFDYVVSTNSISGVRINPEKVVSEMIRVCKYAGEVRIADYSEPPTRTWKNRLVIDLLSLTGDVPHDYSKIFRELGYEPYVENLGLHDTFQYFRIKKH